MNKFLKISLAATLLLGIQSVSAEECQLRVAIASVPQGKDVPDAIGSKLESQLIRAMTSSGIVGSSMSSQFFVAGRFDNSLEDRMSGPAQKYVLKTTLTIYMGDADGQQIYASEAFDLSGVGKSKLQAYQKALSSLNGKNKNLSDFLEKGKKKIIAFFDSNYKSYLTKARRAMGTRSYDEALYYSTAIPECCIGYKEAEDLTLEIYNHYIDYRGEQLLNQARGAWAADPDSYGAQQAYEYLAQIDPGASCYSQAIELGKNIQKTVKANWDFENMKKYNDEVELEKQRIESARAIGVAYGENQPEEVNRYVWLNRYWYW